MPNDIYCVYLTTYLGDKLPPYYIGSTSLKRISEGYRGSVGSKKYQQLWKKELKENPHLFEIEILSTFSTRQEAFDEELRCHKEFDVVKNQDFINLSFAQPNGPFGQGVSGEQHYAYGKNKDNCESLAKLSKSKLGLNKTNNTGMASMSEKLTGRTKEEFEYLRENGRKISAALTGRNKNTHQYIGQSAEKKSKTVTGRSCKLNAELRKIVRELRDSNVSYNNISYYILQNFNISLNASSIYSIYKKDVNGFYILHNTP